MDPSKSAKGGSTARLDIKVNELRARSLGLAQLIEDQLREALLDVEPDATISCSIVTAVNPLWASVSFKSDRGGSNRVFEMPLDGTSDEWRTAARKALRMTGSHGGS